MTKNQGVSEIFLLMLKVTVGGMNEKYAVGLFSSGRPKLSHNLGTVMIMKNQWCVRY